MNPNNYDKESFEDKWRKRLEEAAYEPPPHLWEHIDAHLAKQAQQHRLVAPFYKRLAIAASVLLMALSTTLWLQQKQHRQKEAELQAQIETKEQASPILRNELGQHNYTNEVQTTSANTKMLPKPKQKQAEAFVPSKSLESSLPRVLPTMAYDRYTEQFSLRTQPINIASLSTSKVEKTLWGEENTAPAPQNIKKNKKSAFWLAVDFMPVAANNTMTISYQPVIASAAGRSVYGIDASKVSEELQQQGQAQFSYQTGFQVGYRFYKGFTLQSGVHYTALQSSISTNQYIEQNGQKYPSFLTLAQAEYVPQGDVIVTTSNRGAVPEAITVNNQFQFLSIPLQVGYLFGKNKWRYGLSAGVSANMLLNSTFASSNDASVAALSLGANNQGFYKPVFLSSMASVSVQYLLSEALRLSLQPTYQQALESVAEERSPLQSKPRIWGLNVGISYNF